MKDGRVERVGSTGGLLQTKAVRELNSRRDGERAAHAQGSLRPGERG